MNNSLRDFRAETKSALLIIYLEKKGIDKLHQVWFVMLSQSMYAMKGTNSTPTDLAEKWPNIHEGNAY